MWVCLSPCPCGQCGRQRLEREERKILVGKKLSHNWDMNPYLLLVDQVH